MGVLAEEVAGLEEAVLVVEDTACAHPAGVAASSRQASKLTNFLIKLLVSLRYLHERKSPVPCWTTETFNCPLLILLDTNVTPTVSAHYCVDIAEHNRASCLEQCQAREGNLFKYRAYLTSPHPNGTRLTHSTNVLYTLVVVRISSFLSLKYCNFHGFNLRLSLFKSGSTGSVQISMPINVQVLFLLSLSAMKTVA